MIIYYKKKRLKYQLISGLAILVFGISILILDTSTGIYSIWILFGLLQIGTWFYQRKYQYLYIDEESLTKNALSPSSIKFSELKAIWKYKNSFTLETNTTKIKIDKDLMEDESLYKLTDFINQIELKSQQA
ncbi:hypothetical protein APR41_14600 [Salegentibacter salinarum]|uniref:YcxB-like protein domain-containing protein n=1 Tax=Salegentibacter salinarum TaxID=447422 RepID=A0A2N0TZR0_9FLAO|nr:hypothetical protein [Salegentibacter salinarum]PKD20209.1 hypothetical protein APR41_14600 [Salegentibacter salinarum]SKB87212.1 hypothetical protein SAMN05660903_02973 [Salegentibacter salinarum]